MPDYSWIRPSIQLFNTSSLAHHLFKSTCGSVLSAIDAMAPGDVMALIGPSRVGKTMLCRAVQSQLGNAVPDESGFMPVVLVEAENAAMNGEFSTKGFVADALTAIQHPFYGDASSLADWNVDVQTRVKRTAETMLRSAFEKALRLRKSSVVVVDEAQQIGYARGGNASAARILDSLKCLGNKTGVKIILSGTYELAHLLPLAPHLLGRQRPIEFRRYLNDDSDREDWEDVLLVFSEHLRFRSNDESLLDFSDVLYEGTHGCVGLLSKWIRASLGGLLASGGEFFSEELLHASRLPLSHEQVLLEEIMIGESLLRSKGSGPSQGPTSERRKQQAKGQRKRRRKPFQRTSKRLPEKGRL